ncbi:MAG TPA: response regulator [Gemmatimonadaceae bacterium]|nr:response regulator [Gemmatimonadaceae bacterium]
MAWEHKALPNYTAAFNAAPGNYLLLHPDFRIAGVTDAYLAATMTRREDIVGRGLFEIFPDNPNEPSADGVRNLRQSLVRVIATRRADRMTVQKYDIRRPEDEGGGFEERYWSPLNSPVLGPNGEVELIIHWVEDVTDFVRLKQEIERAKEARADTRRERETHPGDSDHQFFRGEAVAASRRLIETERRHQFLADALPLLIWTADAEGQLDYCNSRWLDFTGRLLEDVRGEGWLSTIHPDDRASTAAAWDDARNRGVTFQHEQRVLGAGGVVRWMLTLAEPYRDATKRVVQWFGSMTDIHDRVEAEQKFRAAQHLQAVGTLAGGMAHEVNNMMTAVLGFGEIVAGALGTHHPQRRDVDEMIRAGARAADVTRQLLAFSRQQVLNPSVLDISLVVTELVPVLRRLIGSDRRLDVRLASKAVRAIADRGQLEQVLINLAANARDATATNGVVAVETETVTLDAPSLSLHREEGASPGSYARITVRDDGTGMSPDTLARAFEPFFTTKAVGHGTGLGLSMVYGIAKQSGGYVHIESALGSGTAVSVYLPFVDDEVTPSQGAREVSRGNGERILVVEDEPVVRSLAQRGLEAAGYRVYQAPNGAAALKFLATEAADVDLVLTDVVMPNMNGQQLAEAIMQRYPGLPVLFMSGYGGDDILRRGLMTADAPFVQKPFTLDVLARAVQQRLEQAAQGRGK